VERRRRENRGRPLEGGRRQPGEPGRLGAHHRPRGSEDAHPGRIYRMRNVKTPLGSGRTKLPDELVADQARNQGSHVTPMAWAGVQGRCRHERSCGVYFGPTGGADSGDSWEPIVRDLPAVLSVEAQTLP
jgi:hypothetical protein